MGGGGEGSYSPDMDDLVERGEGPMVSFVLGSRKRKCLLCDLCLGSVGCTSGGPDHEPEVGTFIFCPENIIPILEEHHHVSLDVAATLSLGLGFPCAWTMAAATWLVSLIAGSLPPACPPDSVTPSSEGFSCPSPNERKAECSCPTPPCSLTCFCWGLMNTWPHKGHALTSLPPDLYLCLGCHTSL